MPRGVVKWFNTAKGFGFIRPEDAGGAQDVFVHGSVCPGVLSRGETVEFQVHINPGSGRPEASSCWLVEGHAEEVVKAQTLQVEEATAEIQHLTESLTDPSLLAGTLRGILKCARDTHAACPAAQRQASASLAASVFEACQELERYVVGASSFSDVQGEVARAYEELSQGSLPFSLKQRETLREMGRITAELGETQEESAPSSKPGGGDVDADPWESQLGEDGVSAIPPSVATIEAVLEQRTSRILVVLDGVVDLGNQFAIFRTMEALGVQNVWLVVPERHRFRPRHMPENASRRAQRFLTKRVFQSAEECIEALRTDNREIWVTHLHANAVPLDRDHVDTFPRRLAIVFGSEGAGVSAAMATAADRLVYLPIFGFTESLNVGHAAAMILLRLFELCPEARGDIGDDEKRQLRTLWAERL